jgi:hypothetical protein
MRNPYLKSYLFVVGIFLLMQFSCNNPIDNSNEQKIDLKDWTREIQEKGTIYYNDTAWIFLYDSLNLEKDTRDTVIFGPFKGHRPLLDQYEYFDEDMMEDQDDSWVIEYLGDEGCYILVFGFKDGKITLLKSYLLKGCNCGHAVFDTDLKRKTLFGTTYDNDTLKVLVIDYKTGELIERGITENGDYKDVEILDGHMVKISQGDSVYIEVDVTTDINDRYSFPGKFIQAKENGDGCKIIVVKNGNGLVSYILCPDTPINHISSGSFMYGDSLADLQTHTINDTVRLVAVSYDTLNKRTRIDILDTNATRHAQRNHYGKLKKSEVICDGKIKIFVMEDTAANNGRGKIVLDALNISTGVVETVSPVGGDGRIESVSPISDPCGIEIRVRNPDGTKQTLTFKVE